MKKRGKRRRQVNSTSQPRILKDIAGETRVIKKEKCEKKKMDDSGKSKSEPEKIKPPYSVSMKKIAADCVCDGDEFMKVRSEIGEEKYKRSKTKRTDTGLRIDPDNHFTTERISETLKIQGIDHFTYCSKVNFARGFDREMSENEIWKKLTNSPLMHRALFG